MSYYYTAPAWFLGSDVGMEVLYACIAALITFTAYKVYKLSQEHTIKHFAIGFGLISASYISWAGVNAFIFTELASEVRNLCIWCLKDISYWGVYVHTGLFIAGLVSLVYATTNIKKLGIYYLLLGLSLTIITISIQKFATAHVVALFFLTYILHHYWSCYTESKNSCTKKLLLGFSLLVLSSVTFLFAGQYIEAYVLGHLFELAAYITFLVALYQLKYNGKQKKNSS
jgi:hypothetical protein